MKLLTIMRPTHWSKNIFVFAGLIFGGRLVGPVSSVIQDFLSALGAFFCFSMASSAIYIFNDIIDRKADLMHPEKARKPIAAGEVSIRLASIQAVLCAVVAVVCSYQLVREFAVIIIGYIALMVLYSLVLKKVMIFDVIAIAVGFVLRAVAGAVVVGVFVSPWLIICTFALCLFLGFGKRRSELALLSEDSNFFRETLGGYTPELLSHMLDVTSGLAIVCFLLYSTSDRTVHYLGTNNLVYTTPLVLYCVFRFSAVIQKGRYSGPVQIILRDLSFQIGFILWALSCVGIIYAGKFDIGLGGVLHY